MEIGKIIYVLVGFTGLLFIIKFKYLGNSAIKQRKNLNRYLPWPIRQSEDNFGAYAIAITQIGFLAIGIFALFFGLVKLFD